MISIDVELSPIFRESVCILESQNAPTVETCVGIHHKSPKGKINTNSQEYSTLSNGSEFSEGELDVSVGLESKAVKVRRVALSQAVTCKFCIFKIFSYYFWSNTGLVVQF